ncbi:MAG: hypothetical protein AAF519_14290 [Bacteroidota bacterium]
MQYLLNTLVIISTVFFVMKAQRGPSFKVVSEITEIKAIDSDMGPCSKNPCRAIGIIIEIEKERNLTDLKPEDQVIFYFRGTLNSSKSSGVGTDLPGLKVGDQFTAQVNEIYVAGERQLVVNEYKKIAN